VVRAGSDGLVELEGERGRRRRRSWSEDEKQRIVEETLQPGASVSVVARRHDINANLLFTWRRQVRAGELAADRAVAFVPAVIAADGSASSRRTAAQDDRDRGERSIASSPAWLGRMEIVLASGARVIVDKEVNAAALARVVGVLERR
jgi:transposase